MTLFVSVRQNNTENNTSAIMSDISLSLSLSLSVPPPKRHSEVDRLFKDFEDMLNFWKTFTKSK